MTSGTKKMLFTKKQKHATRIMPLSNKDYQGITTQTRNPVTPDSNLVYLSQNYDLNFCSLFSVYIYIYIRDYRSIFIISCLKYIYISENKSFNTISPYHTYYIMPIVEYTFFHLLTWQIRSPTIYIMISLMTSMEFYCNDSRRGGT